jgi:tRNA A37 threonylcarbamoyladenosine dehydratase
MKQRAEALSEWNRSFGGVQRLYGSPEAQSIAQSHVLLIGLGGVGSWSAEALVRSGLGSITMIDSDHVALSNINRQVQALHTTLGQAKVASLRDRLSQISPQCHIHTIEDFVTPQNWTTLLDSLPAPVDAVIDACDQTKTKVALALWARHHGAIFMMAGAAGGKRDAHHVAIQDLAYVHHDPLLARVRGQLRKIENLKVGHAKKVLPLGVTCVFNAGSVAIPFERQGCETKNNGHAASTAVPVGGGAPLNCHGYGSVVSVTATLGFCAAGWVLDRLVQSPMPRSLVSTHHSHQRD